MREKHSLSYAVSLPVQLLFTDTLQSFDRCTQPLGPLKQSLFSCLTCNPPPTLSSDAYTPAGVCYACSIACHGEHTLVELFNKRNFTCDCGTTRLPTTSPCTLRIDPTTGVRGPVRFQPAAKSNTYNQNFRNRFCGCGELYDPHMQKGTMYQCLGLATEEDGGCGEDWWHPECLLGLPHDWYSGIDTKRLDNSSSCANVDANEPQETSEDQDHPVPPGFPDEDHIEALICYKCTSTAPWIKQYGGAEDFTALTYQETSHGNNVLLDVKSESKSPTTANSEQLDAAPENVTNARKRKAEEDNSESSSSSPKRVRAEAENVDDQKPAAIISCARVVLPFPRAGPISLVACNEDFRTSFCRCPECYALIRKYPQLLEEEEIYEPPLSEDGENGEGGSVGTGSLLDRGEAALSNVDRVRAIGNYNRIDRSAWDADIGQRVLWYTIT